MTKTLAFMFRPEFMGRFLGGLTLNERGFRAMIGFHFLSPWPSPLPLNETGLHGGGRGNGGRSVSVAWISFQVHRSLSQSQSSS